ncbi:PREDICTED: protein msta-like [Nicrophorus vespilloides]|uniref:Protein msta-like n=1 Tax=Nicrophorus vespilloides TaxID=110193 RepID=A0ABM1MJ98_NICVS|nr:PREDICTED: protein msta-like [Nicrophorus vespilloides]
MASSSEHKFRVEKNEIVGRYAVAHVVLNPGDVIFEETPFAHGPKPDHPPMCLGCYFPVDCSYLCSKCKWPLCGAECEQVAAHRDAECRVMEAAGVGFQPVNDCSQICLQFECITPLRVLLAKEADAERWEREVSLMESHDEKRRGLPVWGFNQRNVVDYLRGPCKLDRFSEELIHKVCGILEVNAFEAHPTNGGYSIRCLYPKLAILSHNCVSNISHSIRGGDFGVVTRASVKVAEGGELFSSYTYALNPTLVRKKHLRESKYFDCACSRCKDPTELGTHMGTLKCSKCDNGVIISESPLDFDARWKCTHCEFSTSAAAVMRVYEAIQADLDNVDEGVEDASQAIEARETLYKKYRSVLHPRNTFHTILRLSLAQMYGKVEGYQLEELPDLLLERKVELCKELLQNLDVIEPGFTRLRGTILYELHAPLILLARNLYRTHSISKEVLRCKLLEAIELLNVSSRILLLEPETSVEYSLGKGAAMAKQQLEQNLDELVDAEL